MTDLKPCPFCGANYPITYVNPELFWVECTNCDAALKGCSTQEEACTAWNTRPEHPAEKALRELVEEASRVIPVDNGDFYHREEDYLDLKLVIKKAKEALGDEREY